MAEKLQQAIDSIKSGDRNKGKQLLTEILRTEPNNEQARLWMSTVAGDLSQSRIYLQQVLTINPQNKSALQGLEILASKLPQTERKPFHFRMNLNNKRRQVECLFWLLWVGVGTVKRQLENDTMTIRSTRVIVVASSKVLPLNMLSFISFL